MRQIAESINIWASTNRKSSQKYKNILVKKDNSKEAITKLQNKRMLSLKQKPTHNFKA